MRPLSLVFIVVLSSLTAANADDWRVKRAFIEYNPPTSESRTIPAVVYTGTGQVEGVASGTAFYAKVASNSVLNRGIAGNVERKISLTGWRGKRVRLTLRLKTQGPLHAEASAAVVQDNNVLRGTQRQWVPTRDGWQSFSFVRDVPNDAMDFVVDLGLYGRGTLWVDDVALESGDQSVVNPSVRAEAQVRAYPRSDPIH